MGNHPFYWPVRVCMHAFLCDSVSEATTTVLTGEVEVKFRGTGGETSCIFNALSPGCHRPTER